MSNNATAIKAFAKQLSSINEKLVKDVDKILDDSAIEIVRRAKQRAPKDMGNLANEVAADLARLLDKKVTVNAFYAPAVEFGTGKYAAQYVARLPADWQTYAAQFKGKMPKGSLEDFLQKMIEWVKRKGLIGLTKSGNRRSGKKANEEAYNLAYVIVINILRNGIHPHPFLFPSYEEVLKDIEAKIRGIRL